jgi:Kdo2-lipid IVA lauroyltransferase/acyltransferase
VRSHLVYWFAISVLALFRHIPRKLAHGILDLLATTVFYLDARHRRIAHTNLIIAFPELPDRKLLRIARKSFQTTARNLLEVARLPLLTRESVSSLVTYDPGRGLNNYHKALDRGKGILYMTGHFSAWELLPTAHALYGYPLNFITRPLDEPRLEAYLHRIREAAGNRVVPKKNSARNILETLKQHRCVGILMDQNTDPQEGVFVDLFGVPASTSTSMAIFALRTDAPIIPGYLSPMRKGRYSIIFLPPLEVVRTGDRNRDIELNTKRFNEVIEGIIREQPESWLWGHKRWNYQPAGNPDLYSLSPAQLRALLTARSREGK